MAFYLLRAIPFIKAKGILSVEINGEQRLAEFDAMNRQFSAIYFEKYSSGYEPEVTCLIEKLIPDGGIFYDIGSNWGFFSFYLASRKNFTGQIHAFEPWPPTYSNLKNLVDSLKLDSMIHCHQYALSDETGSSSMRSPSHSGLAHLSGDGGVKVKISSLDELPLNPPSLIKIDAEGAEDKILLGGRKFLSEHTPMLIFENRVGLFGDKKCSAVLEMLEALEYKLFAVKHQTLSRESRSLKLQHITSKSRKDHSESDNLFACHISEIEQLNALEATPNEMTNP